jgi:hypothetical protein
MNTYGAKIDRFEKVYRPDGLTCLAVTYTDEFSNRSTYRTVPGSTVNSQVESLQAGRKVDVILNGRNQIVAVREYEAALSPEVASSSKTLTLTITLSPEQFEEEGALDFFVSELSGQNATVEIRAYSFDGTVSMTAVR